MIAYSETIVTGSVQDWLLALRTRRISAVELLDVYWKRIAQYNYELKAIVTFNEEDAWLSARRADDLRARGVDGPLLGIPITVKETMDVRGLPTTLGIPERADCVASSDSDLVGCLRATGAVVLGKTNIPPYAADWQASNALFGRSRNPWDGSRTPGGSTGGGAAAVSAGLTTLEFGTDIAGSIRIPGAFCGVYGHIFASGTFC